MGHSKLSSQEVQAFYARTTRGGTVSATYGAEERIRQGRGLDPLVDPKGLAHLGPVRMSLPRFEQQSDGLWVLTRGLPMAEETLLDTTASMGDNVDLAFKALPNAYEMLTSGNPAILRRYDPQIATAIFNDVEDGPDVPVLARSQFEMAQKIAQQMTLLVPGRRGCGNGKENSEFGLFAGAYLTAAAINKWGLKGYHFTVSDEPTVPTIDLRWLRTIFGEDVLEHVNNNGFEFHAGSLPNTAQVVRDLQARAHAFFLQVPGHHLHQYVTDQWTDLYGEDHFIMLPGGTKNLHYVKVVLIGLTEGVLSLDSAGEFLREHGLDAYAASEIVRAVQHIPLGAQTLAPNFNSIPLAGAVFRSKTDLWPIDPDEISGQAAPLPPSDGPNWL